MRVLADQLLRFGNYIGEAAQSDEELDQEDNKPEAFNYDEAFGADEDDEVAGQELMEVDGALLFYSYSRDSST